MVTKPCIRWRCSSGTMVLVTACIADHCRLPKMEEIPNTTKMCQISTRSSQNMMIKKIVPSEMIVSVITSTQRRSIRSTKVPRKGPSNAPGTMIAMLPLAKVVAEPVVSVSHQTMANCTSTEPRIENASPIKRGIYDFSYERSFSGCLMVEGTVVLSEVLLIISPVFSSNAAIVLYKNQSHF